MLVELENVLIVQCPVLTAGTLVVVVEGLIGLVVQGWLIVVSLLVITGNDFGMISSGHVIRLFGRNLA